MHMSEACQALCNAAAGKSVDDIQSEITASGVDVADPATLAAYLLKCATEPDYAAS